MASGTILKDLSEAELLNRIKGVAVQSTHVSFHRKTIHRMRQEEDKIYHNR